MSETNSQFVDWLGRAQAGDAAALGELLAAHRGYLKMVARRWLDGKLGARLDESDLAQQTCLSAVRNFATFRGQTTGEFVAWLQEIHRRNLQDAARDHLQAARRAAGREEALDGFVPVDVMTSSPGQRILESEQSILLAQALETLPADQCEAVRLRFLEGLSLAEIAERMGRSRDAAAGLLKRGVFQLRSQWK